MRSIAGDWIGLLHAIFSLLAMLFGTLVLASRKGTSRHNTVGYLYFVSMLLVLITALFIYRLFGVFGPFHYIAVVGFVYLLTGVLPALLRWKNWLKQHVYFMYWSVVGLYAAFAAEVAVRLSQTPFWWMVGVGTALVTIAGAVAFGKCKQKWYDLKSTAVHEVD